MPAEGMQGMDKLLHHTGCNYLSMHLIDTHSCLDDDFVLTEGIRGPSVPLVMTVAQFQ